MKKLLLILTMLLFLTSVKAQNYVHFAQCTIDSSGMTFSCNKAFYFNLQCNGKAHGYTSMDTMTMHINFGDGIDSTFKANLINDSIIIIWRWFIHHYANPGVVDINLKLIAPDGMKDSCQFANHIIGDTCDYIKGVIFRDNNSNCLFDGGDNYLLPASVQIQLFYNNQQIYSFMNYDTAFSCYLPKGFNYDLAIQNNANSIFCPSINHIMTVPSSSNNFGFQCPIGFDLTSEIYGWGFSPGSHGAEVFAWPENFSCVNVDSGRLKLVYNNTLLTPTYSDSAFTISGDTIIWQLHHLNSFINSPLFQHYVFVHFDVSPLAQIGDTLCFTLIETPFSGDIDTINNVQYKCFPVLYSCDPNDKQVTPQGDGDKGYIANNQNMFYTIRFQNTGNAPAQNINIIDTLDSNLDIGTFAVVYSDHNVNTSFIGSNTLKFNFPNINLPDSGTDQQASQGHISYTIHQKPNLPPNTEIKNTAYIYFDNNQAVATNTTINTIKSPSAIHETPVINSISVYPNPSTGIIYLSFDKTGKDFTVNVMNSMGQLLMSRKISNRNSASLDLSAFPKGIYFIKVQDENRVIVKKVIIE